MKYRKLRIAWSVAWGIAALLLIVLWARSYWVEDYVAPRLLYPFYAPISTSPGGLVVFSPNPVVEPSNLFWGWTSKWVVAGEDDENATPKVLGFRFPKYESYVQFPYWFIFTVAALIGGSAWLSWRFTVRTLLIATTLVAIALGLIMWLTARPPASPSIDQVDAPVF